MPPTTSRHLRSVAARLEQAFRAELPAEQTGKGFAQHSFQ